MRDNRVKDFKVGIFVTIGVAFSMVTILVLGGAENAFTRKTMYRTHFSSANGLIPGAKVVLSGLPVGTVREVEYDAATKTIAIELSVQTKYAPYVTQGSNVEIMTQGVLGDKFLAINPGADATPLAEGSEIEPLPVKDVTAFFSKSDTLMVNLNQTVESLNRIMASLEKGNRIDTIASNLASASKGLAEVAGGKGLTRTSKSLADILEKIDSGTGTLGALVNDPGLYEDARALVGGANRNRIVRNLVRKTAKDGKDAKNAKDAKNLESEE